MRHVSDIYKYFPWLAETKYDKIKFALPPKTLMQIIFLTLDLPIFNNHIFWAPVWKNGGDFVLSLIIPIDIGDPLSSADVDVDGLVYKRFSDSAPRRWNLY